MTMSLDCGRKRKHLEEQRQTINPTQKNRRFDPGVVSLKKFKYCENNNCVCLTFHFRLLQMSTVIIIY